MSSALRWLEDDLLVVDGQRYLVLNESDGAKREPSTSQRMVLVKTREMVEVFEQRYAREASRNILEIGIFRGGSTALYQQLLQPEKLVAIDRTTEPVPALEEFIERHGLADKVCLYYGVDQADHERVSSILDAEFGDDRLDLVIDDASHWYPETRATFEVAFPCLAPGGRYIIEDWDWAHYDEERWQRGGGLWSDRPALTNLVVELLLVAGSYPDIVRELRASQCMVEVTRGERELPRPVELSRLYLNRGRDFRPLL
jgi:predicted O-methyltransferase YrrM